MRSRGLPVLLLAVVTSSAAAQADVVPRRLALSIVHFWGISSNDFFGQGPGEASLATNVPASIAPVIPTPPRGNVLGTVSWPKMADVFGIADGSVESVRTWFVDEFKRRGYPATNEDTRLAMWGGFRDPQTGPVGRGTGYCAQADLLNIDVLAVDQRSVEYRVRLTREHQSCRNMGPRGRAPGFISPPELPTLLNPLNSSPNLRAYPFDGCGDRNGGGTAALLTTTMSPADLIKHYDRQMSTSGWKQAPVPSKASSTWIQSDTAGNETVLTLTATAGRLSPNCRYVEMSITRPTARTK